MVGLPPLKNASVVKGRDGSPVTDWFKVVEGVVVTIDDTAVVFTRLVVVGTDVGFAVLIVGGAVTWLPSVVDVFRVAGPLSFPLIYNHIKFKPSRLRKYRQSRRISNSIL